MRNFVLDGELTDEDNTTFNKVILSHKPGSKHSSFSKKDVYYYVFKKKKQSYLNGAARELNSVGGCLSACKQLLINIT